MNIAGLLTDNRAVSPIITVALLVSITVIAVSVFAGFVIPQIQQTGDGAPKADFSFDYGADSGGYTNGTVTVTHVSGESFTNNNSGELLVKAQSGAPTENERDWIDGVAGDGSVDPADDITIGQDSSNELVTTDNMGKADRVYVVWQSPDGEQEVVLDRFIIP